MGQGHYTVLVWGVLRTPDMRLPGDDIPLNENEPWEELFDDCAAQGVRIDRSYESANEWFGCIIAEGGYGLSWSEVPEMGDFGNTAIPIAEIAKETFARWPERLRACQESYEALRTHAKAAGLDLPPGQLLLVSDYD